MKIFSNTNIGLKRSSNQDDYRQAQISENALWSVICDGMGGVNGGNIASEAAVEIANKILSENFREGMSEEELLGLCKLVINEANSTVFEKSMGDYSLRGMGTTMVLILIDNNKLCVAHVGDSRAYLIRQNVVNQVTTDHSFVQDLIKRGEITSEEARIHPHRNIITRSVGVHESVEIDFAILNLEKDDTIISCTDGLSNYLNDEVVRDILLNSGDNVADDFVEYAINCGGVDNVTVTVIKI